MSEDIEFLRRRNEYYMNTLLICEKRIEELEQENERLVNELLELRKRQKLREAAR